MRVIAHAAISLLSGLWAVVEWRSGRSTDVVVDAAAGLDAGDGEWRKREAKRLELAERKLTLAERREARLASRDQHYQPPGGNDAA